VKFKVPTTTKNLLLLEKDTRSCYYRAQKELQMRSKKITSKEIAKILMEISDSIGIKPIKVDLDENLKVNQFTNIWAVQDAETLLLYSTLHTARLWISVRNTMEPGVFERLSKAMKVKSILLDDWTPQGAKYKVYTCVYFQAPPV
jgi:hypothetical protein